MVDPGGAAPSARAAVSILESQGNGHRLGYVGRIARSAVDRDTSATIVVPSSVRAHQVVEWGSHIGATADRAGLVEVRTHRVFGGHLLRRAMASGEVLLIPDGDRWLPALLIERILHRSRSRVPVALLIMRPYPPGGGWRARANYGAKVAMIRLLERPSFATRIGVLRGSGAPPPPTWSRSTVVSDPPLSTRRLPDAAEAKREAGLEGAVAVAILGEVSRRKNPILILEALQEIAATRPREPWVLYLPGDVDPEVGAALQTHAGDVRIVRGSGHLDAARYAASFAAADIVVVVHSNEGSSGVLTEAAAYGKRAVAGGVETVRQQGTAVGAVVPTDGSVRALAAALRRSESQPAARLPVESTSDVVLEDFFLGAGAVAGSAADRAPTDGSEAERADRVLAEFFDEHGAAGMSGVARAVRHPRAALGAFWSIRGLPVIRAEIGRSREGLLVREGLLRRSRIARSMLGGLTAVLALPGTAEGFATGSSSSKRSLRTKIHRAERAGLTWELVESPTDRAALLEIANDFERSHPLEQYRNESPDNDYLLPLRVWLVCRDATGVPLLLTVPAIDGEWAILQYFKTVQDSEEASLARYLMSAVLADELGARGVRFVADLISPAGLDRGLRLFQRRLGYRFVRVDVRSR